MFSKKGEANPEFQNWVADYVPYLHVTSRVYTDPDHALFTERGGFGFPYLAFLDAEGNLLSQVGQRSIDGLTAAAEAAAAANELTDPADLYLHRLGMRGLAVAEAKAGLEKHREAIPAAALSEVEQLVVDREIGWAFYELQREHGSKAMDMLPAPAAALVRQGKGPASRLAPYFYPAAMKFAVEQGDADLAKQVLELAEKLLPDDSRRSRVLQGLRDEAAKVSNG